MWQFCHHPDAGQHPNHSASSHYQSFPPKLSSCQHMGRCRAEMLSRQNGRAGSPVLEAWWLHIPAQPGLRSRLCPALSCLAERRLLLVPPCLGNDSTREGNCTSFTPASLEPRGRWVQQWQSHGRLIRALKGHRNRKGEVTSAASSGEHSVFGFQVQPVLRSPGSAGLSPWN